MFLFLIIFAFYISIMSSVNLLIQQMFIEHLLYGAKFWHVDSKVIRINPTLLEAIFSGSEYSIDVEQTWAYSKQGALWK